MSLLVGRRQSLAVIRSLQGCRSGPGLRPGRSTMCLILVEGSAGRSHREALRVGSSYSGLNTYCPTSTCWSASRPPNLQQLVLILTADSLGSRRHSELEDLHARRIMVSVRRWLVITGLCVAMGLAGVGAASGQGSPADAPPGVASPRQRRPHWCTGPTLRPERTLGAAMGDCAL